MNKDEFDARLEHLLLDEWRESGGKMSWFYLSYAGDNGFRGGVYLRAYGPVSAARRANIDGISPGGEVRMVGPLDPDNPDVHLPPPEYRDRLLTLEELKSLSPMVNWDGESA